MSYIVNGEFQHMAQNTLTFPTGVTVTLRKLKQNSLSVLVDSALHINKNDLPPHQKVIFVGVNKTPQVLEDYEHEEYLQRKEALLRQNYLNMARKLFNLAILTPVPDADLPYYHALGLTEQPEILFAWVLDQCNDTFTMDDVLKAIISQTQPTESDIAKSVDRFPSMG